MELNFYIEELQEGIEKTINNFEHQLLKVAVGKANPTLINKIKINYYDSWMNLEELASISPNGPLELLVKPYDMGILKNIEKTIMDQKLNITIVNVGHQLRLIYPQMTTEKRVEMTKVLNQLSEQAKVGIRQIRQDTNKQIKADKELSEDLQKNFLDQIQKEIDKAIEKINNLVKVKEKELMTI
ncbi:Ribosome recycling factor (Ribosome releasing factor) [Metamycoplasma auris 15026]|uniref:Ribosome recycling factor (Ribosome releasing factor) n=1 Tax=Metamycoplasma auris 15026 TaxID=1188233 RepID=N9TTI3_9BACT|nr:ribosome-recycling factor [Metamycoplasma auris]ENY69385.1 Ribosome recycling factor (Ribosome releasing factor) [Metamycoplasma auris 15026]